MDSALVESLLQRVVTGVLVGSIYGLLCTGPSGRPVAPTRRS